MRIRNGVAGAVLAAVTLGIASPASADTLEVPQDFSTIQAAVDAASGGDVVAIKKRKAAYDENVVVGIDDLTIKGVDGRPVIDAWVDSENTTVPAFDVDANGVSIRNVEIHHGGGIDCTGADCNFSTLRFRGKNQEDCVEITGDRGQVTSSVFAGCDQNAVHINGDDGVLRENKADLIDSDCFEVVGERLVFEDNASARCEDGSGLELSGDDALIRNSTVRNTDNESFRLTGDDLRVTKNVATETDSDCFAINGDRVLFSRNTLDVCDDGLQLSGHQARATKNEISHGDQSCLRISGNEALVHRNKIDACYRGVDVSGQDPVVTENTIDRIFVDDGISFNCYFPFIEGEPEPDPEDVPDCDDALVAFNVINQSGDDDEGISVSTHQDASGIEVRENVVRGGLGVGIRIFASGTTIVENRVKGNGSEEEAGIELDGSGNTLLRNVSNANGGEGFDVFGDDNELRGNTASANFQDGIRVEGNGNALFENETRKNLAEGIEIRGYEENLPDTPASGLDTTVVDNVSAGNGHVDCAADLPFVTFSVIEGNQCADGSDFGQAGSGPPRR